MFKTWFQNRRRRDKKNGIEINKVIDKIIRKQFHAIYPTVFQR